MYLKVGLEWDQILGNVVIGNVEVVGDLLGEGGEEWLEGGGGGRGPHYPDHHHRAPAAHPLLKQVSIVLC